MVLSFLIGVKVFIQFKVNLVIVLIVLILAMYVELCMLKRKYLKFKV